MLTVHACARAHTHTHTPRSCLLEPHESWSGSPPAGGACPTWLVSLQDAVPTASPATRRRSWQRSTKMAQSRGPSLCTRTSCYTSLVCIPPNPTDGTRGGRYGFLAGRTSWGCAGPPAVLRATCRWPLSQPLAPALSMANTCSSQASPTFCSFWSRWPHLSSSITSPARAQVSRVCTE